MSRETLREQKNAALRAMKEALKEKKRGRKPNTHVANLEEAVTEIGSIRKELSEEKKQRKALEKENLEIKRDLWMARHVIGYWQREGRIDIKKKGTLWKVLRNMFSRVPKRLFEQEEISKAHADAME